MAEIVNLICSHFGVPEDRKNQITYRIMNSSKFYKHASIPKRDGGTRKIFLPTVELKAFQHLVCELFISKLPVSKSAFGYVKSRNTKQFVSVHKGNSYFLKVDLSSFFDTIKTEYLVETLHKNKVKLSEEGIKELISVTTYKSNFVQGNVSSPMISNAIFYEIDNELTSLTQSLTNGVYSRYSDDMVFSSSKFIEKHFYLSVKKIIKKHNFCLNEKKTLLRHLKNGNIRITGLNLLDDLSISVGTKFKKELKSSIYQKLKHNENSSETINKLIGKLYYLKYIEPLYFNKLNLKYSIVEKGKKQKLLLTRLLDLDTKNRKLD